MKLPQSHQNYLTIKTPVQACSLPLEVVEFPLVNFNCFSLCSYIDPEKDCVFGKLIHIAPRKCVKTSARIKVSITRLPQNYLRINFMVLGT